jgi:hypothetical protein
MGEFLIGVGFWVALGAVLGVPTRPGGMLKVRLVLAGIVVVALVVNGNTGDPVQTAALAVFIAGLATLLALAALSWRETRGA